MRGGTFEFVATLVDDVASLAVVFVVDFVVSSSVSFAATLVVVVDGVVDV